MKSGYHWYFVCLLIGLCQTAPLLGQHLSFRNIGLPEGLPSSNVYAIHQDPRGYIWLGTDAGLCRYNGESCQVYTIADGLPDNEILGFFADSQDRIWLYTYNGQPGFIQRDSIFHPGNTDWLAGCAPSFFTHLIQEGRSGEIFFAAGPTYQLQPGKPPQVIACAETSFFSPIAIQSKGDTAYEMICGDKSVIISSGSTCRPGPPTPTFFMRGRTKSIILSPAEILVAYKQDLYLKKGGHWSNIAKPFQENIISLYHAPDEKIWVGTEKGLYRFNRDFSSVVQIMDGHTVSGVLCDDLGQLWVITLGEGVFFTARPSSISWGQAEGISSIYALSIDPKNRLWAGGKGDELFHFQGRDLAHLPLGLSGSQAGEKRIQSLLWDRKGNLWGGGDKMSFRRAPDLQIQIGMPALKTLALDPQGRVWAGFPLGVFELTPANVDYMMELILNNEVPFDEISARRDSFQISSLRTSALAFDTTSQIFIGARNGLWQGWEQGPGEWDLQPVPELEGTGILDLALVPGPHLWGATAGKGLFLQTPDSLNWFTQEDGLPGNTLQKVFLDETGEVWAASKSGLAYLIQQDSAWNIRAFGESEGLINGEVNDVVLLRDTVWIGTAAGLTAIPRSDLLAPISPPRLYLKALYVQDQLLQQVQALDLSHRENRIRITFEVVDYGSGGQMFYRYRLLGQDSSWSLGQAEEVSFNTLPPGDYVFEAEARRGSGPWSAPVRLPISVAKAWYQMVGVWILGGLFYLALVWFLFRYRLKRIRLREALQRRVLESEQKALRAQMNPHFIFNALNSVQQFFLNRQAREGNFFLHKFSTLIRKILENSDQLYLSIEEELEMVRPYMDFEKLRSGDHFEFELSIDPKLDPFNTLIPGMLIQPLLENAIWHGVRHLDKDGRVELRFLQTSHGLLIQVADNGIGREKAAEKASAGRKAHRSMGLQLIQNRIGVINALGNDKLKFELSDQERDDGTLCGTLASIYITKAKH